jgi:hypothetical protein
VRFYSINVINAILNRWFEAGFDREQVRKHKFVIVFSTCTLILSQLDIGYIDCRLVHIYL